LTFCFLFWFGFVVLLFILTGCCYSFMVLNAKGLEGHFSLPRENGQERIGQVGEAQGR
jgi:hypothetical protein